MAGGAATGRDGVLGAADRLRSAGTIGGAGTLNTFGLTTVTGNARLESKVWHQNATLDITGLGGSLSVNSAAVLNNAPGATITVSGSAAQPITWSSSTGTLNNGGINLWLQPLDGSAPRPLTDFKDELIYRFAWSPDGKSLVYERGTTVNEVVLMRAGN